MDFDSDEYSDDVFNETNGVDNFLFKYSDEIHDLYNDLKYRFGGSSPFFLSNMELYNLTHFLCDMALNLVKQKPIKYKTYNYTFTKPNLNVIFNTFYKNEIEISYGILFNFSKRTLQFNLQYDDWLTFCYQFTDKYELYN